MIILAAILVLGTITGSVEPPPPPAAKLVLTLEPYKTAVVLDEPVTLTYKVKNPTTEAIKSNVELEGIELLIKGPDGKTEKHTSLLGDGILLEATHEPGSVMVSENDLGWKEQESVFPVVGAYEIRGRVYAGSRPNPVYLESNLLRIEVRKPSAVDVQSVAALGSRAELTKLLRDGPAAYCDGRDKPTCFEQLARFVEQFGSSAYAPSVTRSLAGAVATGRFDVPSKEDVAIRLYKKFLKQWPDHPNASRVMYGLAVALDKAGRSGEAAQVVLEFEKKFPEQKDKAKLLRTHVPSGPTVAPAPRTVN